MIRWSRFYGNYFFLTLNLYWLAVNLYSLYTMGMRCDVTRRTPQGIYVHWIGVQLRAGRER